MKALNSSFAAANNETKADVSPPTSPLRSGGPGSTVSWDSLGREGRSNVADGPTVADLTAFNGTPAKEPIRTFAGLDSADDLKDIAEAAVRELEAHRRVEAQGRRGRVDDGQRLAQQGLHGLAGVHVQRRHRPGVHAVLISAELDLIPRRQGARSPGRPPAVRGGQRAGACDSGERAPEDRRVRRIARQLRRGGAVRVDPDLAARTDGALFTGPTFNNSLWRDTTVNRDEGTPEVLPITRTANTCGSSPRRTTSAVPPRRGCPTAAPTSSMRRTRSRGGILACCSGRWLKEPRGRDVLHSTHWIPVVTFLQVSADMAVAVDVP